MTITDKSLDSPGHDWRGQPRAVRMYAAAIVSLGVSAIALFPPRALPHPALFAFTLLAVCLTSVWKVNLPIRFGHSTLSVSYSADMVALMLLGPELAIVMAVIGSLVQC